MSKHSDERSDGLMTPPQEAQAAERALLHASERDSSERHASGRHSSERHASDCASGGACAHASHAGAVALPARLPCIVVVDDDADLCVGVSISLGPSCETHCVTPSDAVELLRSLPAVDVALVDCDPPPSVQAPIFRELASWPGAICVLMSANVQKVEQLRALGVFAPLVLDKPLHREALEAIRSATLELCQTLG